MKITKRLATIIFALAVVLTTCPVSTAIPAFADELESLTSGGTIVTGDYRLDSDLTTPIKVKSFNSVTIDLNGHKITTAGTAIENEGNLTFNGDGEVTSSGSEPVIINKGYLTVNSGTFTSAGTGVVISNGRPSNEDGLAEADFFGETITLKGNTLFAINSDSDYSKSSVIIDGGSYLGKLNLKGSDPLTTQIWTGTYSEKVPKELIHEPDGYKSVVKKNSDGTYKYTLEEFFTFVSSTKVKYYGKTYKVTTAVVDKKGNLVYIYKKKIYRVTPKGKKKLLSKKGKSLHISQTTGKLDYAILTNGKKLKL